MQTCGLVKILDSTVALEEFHGASLFRERGRTNVLRLARIHEQHRSSPDSERNKTIGWESSVERSK